MNLVDSIRYALLKLEEADAALVAVEKNLRAAGKDQRVQQRFDDVEVYVSNAAKAVKDELHYLEKELLSGFSKIA